jgi:hypothetical protein
VPSAGTQHILTSTFEGNAPSQFRTPPRTLVRSNMQREEPMNRRNILALFAISALVLPGSAIAQQKSIKEQIAGSWTFVSALDVYPDGR